MKLSWKLILVSIVAAIFSFSCTKGKTSPTFKYQKNAGDGVAAKVDQMVITEKELMDGIESELYEAEMKIFEIKFNKLKSLILKKYIDADPNKKGMSNDEFMDKFIAKDAKVSEKQINEFIKEKKIPDQHINPQIKERIRNYLLVEVKKKAVDEWLSSKTKGKTINVFFEEPRRPTFDIKVGDAPFFGGKNAKVEIVEFSDFQCPFCAKAADIVGQIKKKYGNKVKIAFKQFPLPFHSQAKVAAQAALCANEQDVKYFWKMHDAMFADQAKLKPADLKNTAKSLGLNADQFNKCLDTQKYAKKVDADIEEGKVAGVKSTPTFYVNGQLINGAQPIEVFSQLIDSELSK